MEEDFFALIVCAIIAGQWTWRNAQRLLIADALACGSGARHGYIAMFAGCLAVFVVALACVATDEVRGHPLYWALFLCSTIIALSLAVGGLSLLGLDPIQDGIERNNPAVRLVAFALCPAVTLCSIGANIGEGDAVATTFIPQLLAVAVLLLMCALFSAATPTFTLIGSDRDRAAAARLASLLLAWSALLANSAHGDWVSLEETVRSFGYGVAACAAVLVVAVVVERGLQTRAAPSSPWRTIVGPALMNLGLTAFLFLRLPR